MPDPKKKITIDLLRHGQPEGGEVVRGRVDHALTELGWSQMRQATSLLDNTTSSPSVSSSPISPASLSCTETPAWTHIISSPLARCREFAQHAAGVLDLDIDINELWQEIDYGDWDGMPLSDWRREAAPQFKAFREDLSKLLPPGGEAYLDFRDRVLSGWKALAELPDASHVLVVTHGGVLRVVLPTVLGMPLNRSFPLHIPFACFSRVSMQVEDEQLSVSLLFHNAAEYPSSSS